MTVVEFEEQVLLSTVVLDAMQRMFEVGPVTFDAASSCSLGTHGGRLTIPPPGCDESIAPLFPAVSKLLCRLPFSVSMFRATFRVHISEAFLTMEPSLVIMKVFKGPLVLAALRTVPNIVSSGVPMDTGAPFFTEVAELDAS